MVSMPDPLKIRGVLFDFDVTLTRPGAIDFAAIKKEIHCPEGTAILEYIEALPPAKKNALMRVLEQRENEAAQASLPNEGAERCLMILKERGLPRGILTRNSYRSVCLALKNFQGVEPEDFIAIITREDSLPKPHPDGVLKAARRMGIPAAELMFVGDFRFDIVAGRAAGAFTVLLNNGGSKGQEIRTFMASGDPEPHCTIERLEQILEALGITSP